MEAALGREFELDAPVWHKNLGGFSSDNIGLVADNMYFVPKRFGLMTPEAAPSARSDRSFFMRAQIPRPIAKANSHGALSFLLRRPSLCAFSGQSRRYSPQRPPVYRGAKNYGDDLGAASSPGAAGDLPIGRSAEATLRGDQFVHGDFHNENIIYAPCRRPSRLGHGF